MAPQHRPGCHGGPQRHHQAPVLRKFLGVGLLRSSMCGISIVFRGWVLPERSWKLFGGRGRPESSVM